jgi:hypothetical protein
MPEKLPDRLGVDPVGHGHLQMHGQGLIEVRMAQVGGQTDDGLLPRGQMAKPPEVVGNVIQLPTEPMVTTRPREARSLGSIAWVTAT